MIALAGMGRGFHFPQERVHLLGIKPAPRPHAHVAGERASNLFQPFLQRQGIAAFGDFIGKVVIAI